MAYPVQSVTMPRALAGKSNGKLPDSILVDTPGQAGGPVVRLIEPAARAWRAFCAAGLKAGHIFKVTSIADSYRTYAIQELTFKARYTTTPLAGRPSVMWNGQRWYQKPRTAVAAIPGTSNHGWALAADTGEERDSDAEPESLDNATLAWMIANELDYGFSHELQSEPWHIRYWAGDDIPAAVLAYERGEDDMDVFLRGEGGEIAIMSGNTVRGIPDMRSLTLNLTVRGIKNPTFAPVLMADVNNGIYGVDIYDLDDVLTVTDEQLQKLAELLASKSAEEIRVMVDQELDDHFAAAVTNN